MALDARTRSSIYEKLRPILGDQEANALMSELPATDADELVTRQFLRAELADQRAELRGEIGGLRAELHHEIGGLRAELHDEIGGLRAELHDLGRQVVMWNTGSILTGIGLAVAITRIVG